MTDTCPRPFAGMVFCATGTLDKMSLFKKATELGAKSTHAFTDKVTHLIASGHGGAKYNCALERRIPILKPTYVTENYEVWLRGDDVDAVGTLADHQHPIFAGVVVCVSGIDDIDRRVEINKLVNAHGGSFRKELQRPVDVTHLLCSGDVSEPTDKIHYAEKFNQRGETNIKLVWEEWFWDCLEFGGHFDEEKYLVKRHPRPERRRRPVEAAPQASVPDTTTPHESQPTASRRASTDRVLSEEKDNHPSTARKDEDAELEDEETGRVNTNFTALCIWESLLKVRGYTIDGGRVVRSPTKAGSGEGFAQVQSSGASEQQSSGGLTKAGSSKASSSKQQLKTTAKIQRRATGEDSDIDMDGDNDNEPAGGSVLSTLRGFRKQNSFVVGREPARAMSAGSLLRRESSLSRQNSSFARQDSSFTRQDSAFSRTRSSTPARETRPSTPEPEAQHVASGSNQPIASGSGSQQPIASEASSSRPRKSPNFFAGKRFALIGEADSPSVRSALAGAGGLMCAELDAEADFMIVRLADLGRVVGLSHARDRLRTECWVEKCICEKRICGPDEHLTFTPLNPRLFPIEDTSRIVLSFSGLDEAEACWIRRLLRAIGITHAPTFTRRTTHLLCPSREGKKFEKAPEWGIEVVGMDWLHAVAREGRVPGKEVGSASGKALLSGSASMKGKGKGRMGDDITSETTNIPVAQAMSTPLFRNGSFGTPELLIPTPNDSFGQPNLLIPNNEVLTNKANALTTDADNGHVSSSATPSPMKVGGSYSLGHIPSPAKSTTESPEEPPDTSPAKLTSPFGSPSKNRSPMRRKRSSGSLSPAKMAPGLQASIATLLGNGKRGAEAEGGPRKRPKPDFRVKAAAVGTPSPPPEESYAPLEMGEEQSLRVVYADAGERERVEKEREREERERERRALGVRAEAVMKGAKIAKSKPVGASSRKRVSAGGR
ncbi:hypothetical protein K523DRAFT_417061 [Schizophyllum commune Tattone D]|nr:hypothetical protein K523DRAFT_417061 [Schizophyllum commune Tattone D]